MLNIRSLSLLLLYLSFFRIPTVIAQDSIPYLNLHVQNGDLLFIGAQKEQLSGAINRVTQQQSDISYDHVGILEVCKDQIYILHAIGKKGSVREPLDSLVSSKDGQKQQFALYRLSGAEQSAVTEAIDTAKTLLGQPYNWSYVLNDTSLYCSDFVERAFRHAEIFELEPMTFINPATKKTDSFWVNFYQKLNMEVPEGKLGCNPNGLAANKHLIRIGYLESVTK
ncbi:YiiX/YebB-like N1pC/P60 family cysteine hydrolase [Algoriphagus sp. C2-6-M1]|uniref:YiiX/YebB-like N1pC/P60 family cysteine hydrolase n=1 Tax=Algoriphagus persicinus TaxID=3108754 RepID=UPI002B3819CC|nr:YiiX/YebB-like N1pC/P60 family cysteine hydrolase [Algoriphagus sp. C2-6-M1]MEB2782140.1 YiiX/YebB-like N1pC/P60 family cysteine hydrolase [Algoriphagus sp. C2-6-M1]